MIKRFFSLLVFSLLLTEGADALPSFEEVRKSYTPSESYLVDRHGELLHELRTDKNRRRLEWTSLIDISAAFQEAVIHAEDRRFYGHSGVDYRSIGGAVLQGLTTESLRGASTITMQLASLLNRELQPKKGRKSIWQKGQQVLEAWEIEEGWSKKEILEAYLNLVTFRGELQGVAAASRGLFGKDPHGLDRLEALILASLIRSPNAASSDLAKRVTHLNQSITWQISEKAIQSRIKQVYLGSNFLNPRIALAPHIARPLLRDRKNGSPSITRRHQTPGFGPGTVEGVICTLDSGAQRFALDCLSYHLLPLKTQNVRDGAILVVENRTGDILAYVSHSGVPLSSRFVDGVQAKRQAGSSLKPFLYALAFDRRILTPASLLNDTPLDLAVLGGVYQPQNYDSQFRGFVTARMALASSLNIPAVRTLSLVGIEPFLKELRALGLKGLDESGDFYGPSLALGSVDVSLWELVNAYRTLANHGSWGELRLTFEAGHPSTSKQIFSQEATFLVSDILSDREARSLTFGLENSLATRFWTAVKTGTSKEMRDNWCIGYSRKYTVGVWVGNFTGEPMWSVSGVTGAAPIWVEMMNWLHRNDVGPTMEPPTGIVRKEVNFPQSTGPSREEWFVRGTEPHSKDKRIGQFNQRIVYPPSGTVIAVDPDIPPELQKIFFISQTNEEDLRWVLNGHTISRVGTIFPWTPKTGTYLLALCDGENGIIDSVNFEVRGSADLPPLPFGLPARSRSHLREAPASAGVGGSAKAGEKDGTKSSEWD
jgi:penicillin-binding protein 1C